MSTIQNVDFNKLDKEVKKSLLWEVLKVPNPLFDNIRLRKRKSFNSYIIEVVHMSDDSFEYDAYINNVVWYSQTFTKKDFNFDTNFTENILSNLFNYIISLNACDKMYNKLEEIYFDMITIYIEKYLKENTHE